MNCTIRLILRNNRLIFRSGRLILRKCRLILRERRSMKSSYDCAKSIGVCTGFFFINLKSKRT
jgi:hypothetical protein